MDTYVPEDETEVGLLVQVMVGPHDGPGEEFFDVMVCTPRWLQGWVVEQGIIIGRHHLIIERWDTTEIEQYLTAVFEQEEADTWEELGERLGRIGEWEFEDWQEWNG